MLNETQKYMSSAKAAADLALSIVTVKNLVFRGELEGERSAAGHWRISVRSIDEYRKAHNYKERPKKGKICILHRGDDLDPVLLQSMHSQAIQVISHPWELVDLDPLVGVLFIDARHLQPETVLVEMIEGIQKKYKVLIYNSQVLPVNSPFLNILGLHWVSTMINAHFVSGYEVAKQLQPNRRIRYSARPSAAL